jgi:MFS family permease
LSKPEELAALSPWRRPEFVKLFGISITVALGFGMVIPVLPVFGKSFGVSLAVLGLVQVVFGLTRFSFGLVGGFVVDRFGERACTIAGLLIVALSSYAVGFSQNFPQLVLARGFGGAGSALFIGGLQNRIIRIIEPEAMGRATGAFRSSFLVGIVLGPVIGGVVAETLGVRAVFHLYATGLLVAAVIAYVVMAGEAREVTTDRKKGPLEALRAARPLFRDPRYVIALLATFAAWWTISGPGQFIASVFAKEKLDMSSDQIGLAITMSAIGEILVLFVAGRASDRYGRRAALLPSLAVAAAATALIGQIGDSRLLFFPLMAFIGAGVAASTTATGGLLGDAVGQKGSGTAVGVNQMAGDLGYLLAPSLLGVVAEGPAGFSGAYLAGALPAALVLVAALKLPRRERHIEGEQPVEPHPVG